ncbi:MAG: PAS domain S-box protein [Humidesulfovibrio sp.]|nr:PAS domain S-box protein [Humidesulfovibrio sp.]
MAAAPEGQELVAVVPASLPPFYTTTPDGTPSGFAVEVLRQVAARAGYHLRIITTTTPDDAGRLLEQGTAQVLPGMGVSPERSQRFAFTRPIETHPVHIFTRTSGPHLESLAALRGLRVSLLAASIPLDRLSKDQAIIINQSQSLSQALFDLISGGTDALVFQSPLVEQAASAAGISDQLSRSHQPLFEVSEAIAVNRGRMDVLARLDAALGSYRDTPAFRSLYQAWHKEPDPPFLPPTTLWIVAGLFLALTASLLLWRYVSLLHMNRKLLTALGSRDSALAELRLTQDRMETLLTLTHMGGDDTDSLINFALEEGVRLTGSGMGFLFFVEGEDIDLSRVHWSRGGFQHNVVPVARVYPIAQAGLWAECLRTKTPLVINDYAAAPGFKELPPGHAKLERFMAVPLVENDQAVAVFGMANKSTPYDANDTRQLQLFLVGLWRVLASRRDAEAIRQAKDYAESLIEGANAMLVGLDTEGRITVFNAAAETISGFTRAEALGRDWFLLVLPGHLATASAARYRDFMAGRASLPRQHESVLRTKSGQLRHISWQNSLLRQAEAVTGTISYGIDITEQKQAEAKLRRLHRAIEQVAEGVLIADESGLILYANPAFERMTGLRRGSVPPRDLSVFDLDISVLDHHSFAVLGEGQERAWRGTCVFTKSGCAPVEVEFTVSAIRSRADRLVSHVAVCRDVTEKRLLEHQLWQAQKMEALGTLAGGIAHDFNNLLASIMGFTELALDDTTKESRGRACLERVLGASLRARELVRQILSFSRRSEHKLRHLRADSVVAEALKLLEASLAKNIDIQSELNAEATILADPSQIHQIVMNLCTNAAQAMQGTGGRLLVRTSVGPLPPELAARHRLPPGEYLSLLVEDQGPGIGPELLVRIFDPFFTTKAPGEGTGLGLAVVHGIVTSLGGTVWAESEPGQSTRFQILLPTQANVEEAPCNAPSGDLRGQERILLVDDEPDLLELGQLALTPLGYRVDTQSSSEAALRLLLDEPHAFDLVITDMNMPQLSGVQLIEGLRPVRPDLPIIIITGFSRTIPLDRLKPLGVVRLLPKPFSTSELALAVRQALASQTGGES